MERQTVLQKDLLNLLALVALMMEHPWALPPGWVHQWARGQHWDLEWEQVHLMEHLVGPEQFPRSEQVIHLQRSVGSE
jgi:hypothetical protein